MDQFISIKQREERVEFGSVEKKEANSGKMADVGVKGKMRVKRNLGLWQWGRRECCGQR